MRRAALTLAVVGTLGLATTAAPTPANARGWFGPAVIGGLAAGAIFAGLASSAYAWQPYGYYRSYGSYPWGYYGTTYRPYYGYGGYYPGYSYRPYYAPYGTLTVGYAPRYYGYGYRRAYRPGGYFYNRPVMLRYGAPARLHRRHHHWRHHHR